MLLLFFCHKPLIRCSRTTAAAAAAACKQQA
jgi:hypothetical protein